MIRVFDNVILFNPCTGEWMPAAFSVENGRVRSVGATHSLTGDLITDMDGARVTPGLIDTHVHVESTLLTPHEFGRIVLPHGVTTVVADPHEIGNVAGTVGIDFMIADAAHAPNDILFTLPSCVPATADDIGGAVITARDLEKYRGNPRILGLGEMMNVPGVIRGDPEVLAKIAGFSHIDGHAPGVTGEDLCRYVSRGIKTDHECTTANEAREKLRHGMYILLREGDAAKDVAALSAAVTPLTAPRCCFCTDDRHVNLLIREGSIDHCIRVAVDAGVPLELAIRMATLSAAECFGLTDRGLIAPGRRADFCVLAKTGGFVLSEVYKNGVLSSDIPKKDITTPCAVPAFNCRFPVPADLALPKTGVARVIGIIRGEIVTENISLPIGSEGVEKIVSVDRYQARGFSVGLVKGFEMTRGAIAASIAHDAHNLIATGVTDAEILTAMHAVANAGGGMAVVTGDEITLLPLPIGGLMTTGSAEETLQRLDEVAAHLKRTGTFSQAFGHLSFLSLTVIPHLKITPKGLFDVDAGKNVELVQ